MNPYKVLILYSNYGEGHKQAANAIREAFSAECPEAQVVMCDLMGEAHPVWNGLTKAVYESMFTLGRRWYAYWYYKTKQFKEKNRYLEFLSLFGKASLADLLETLEPDLVISTFPTLTRMAAQLKAEGKCRAKVWTVITDYAFHSNWYHPSCDSYFVPCEELVDELVQLGISPSRIHVSGIPIRQIFHDSQVRDEHNEDSQDRNELTKQDPLRVLVSAGALGVLSDGIKLISSLCELKPLGKELQVELICGRNERLYLKALQLEQKYPNLKVNGYVNRIDRLMESADLLITKAGGLTVTEALAMGLPMILYRSLPGQEVENAEYLVKAGVARMATSTSSILESLRELSENPEQLDRMRDQIRNIRHDNSAFYLVNLAMRDRGLMISS